MNDTKTLHLTNDELACTLTCISSCIQLAEEALERFGKSKKTFVLAELGWEKMNKYHKAMRELLTTIEKETGETGSSLEAIQKLWEDNL